MSQSHTTPENSSAASPPVELPATLCGYSVVERLSPAGELEGGDDEQSVTYLAIGPGGRGVVLKRLGRDCLHRGALHPSIRERLERVRELAHPGVANLYGVGRDGADAWLIWEFVEGETLDQYADRHDLPPRAAALLAREVALTVEAVHAQGIVHGAVSAGNVIVTPAGAVRLTHVSPYLYADPAEDAAVVLDLLESTLADRSGSGADLRDLIAEARAAGTGLRALAGRLAAGGATSQAERQSLDIERRADRGGRRRTLAAALLVALAGLALAYGVWHAVGG